jgi:diguanylate cyclase (GGDEF)-like protein
MVPDDDEGAPLPEAPAEVSSTRIALPLPAEPAPVSERLRDTNPAIKLDAATGMMTKAPPTKTFKRVESGEERPTNQGSSGSAEWRTRITKVQVVKPSSSTNDGGACLVLIYPPGSDMGRRFPLQREELVLGRGSDCDIQVDRDSVSRRHARVFRSGNDWCVEDLQSTNGSYVNDVPVQKSPLRDSDFVKIGSAIFKFLVGSGVEASYHEEIYKMTIVDALTGAHNKRYFLEFLQREIARCARYARPLSLVMLDIDHFKQVNDQHGHLTGDYILREIGRRILSRVHLEEVFARYGGEEFALVLPECERAGAEKVAEEVRALVGDQPFDYEGEAIKVTVSVGVATFDGGDIDAMQFIKIADDNLFRAKREGRNRVVFGASAWGRWKADPNFRSRVAEQPAKTAVAALALLARDQMLASAGGGARVDDLEGLLSAHIGEHEKADQALHFGALEGGSKLLIAVTARNPIHRLRLLVSEALHRLSEARPDVQFAVGPVKLAADGPKAIEDAVGGLDDEIAILENGRYLPQPVAVALRATDSITNTRAKYVLELGESLLQWLALIAAADLANKGEPPVWLRRALTGGVTMGRWHEAFVTGVKKILEAPTTVHASAWRACFGDNKQRSELFQWLGSLVELRNAFAHGATASDEHLARKLVDQTAPRLRAVIKKDLWPVLALIAADVELLGFEGDLQSYRLTRLIGDGIPAAVATYSRRRMNPGLWLSDAIADRAVPLEPFFVRDTCPKCGARELFLLTRLDELEFRNPATGHLLKTPVDDLPLTDDARDRLAALTS